MRYNLYKRRWGVRVFGKWELVKRNLQRNEILKHTNDQIYEYKIEEVGL